MPINKYPSQKRMQPKRVRKGDAAPAAKGNCRGVFRSADVRSVLLTETRVRGAGRIGVLTGLPPEAFPFTWWTGWHFGGRTIFEFFQGGIIGCSRHGGIFPAFSFENFASLPSGFCRQENLPALRAPDSVVFLEDGREGTPGKGAAVQADSLTGVIRTKKAFRTAGKSRPERLPMVNWLFSIVCSAAVRRPRRCPSRVPCG
jgi:hypothetical protein